eukprot:scaffold230379_cov22-Prasinocladus_malaysianus.AAC.1
MDVCMHDLTRCCICAFLADEWMHHQALYEREIRAKSHASIKSLCNLSPLPSKKHWPANVLAGLIPPKGEQQGRGG